MFLASNWVQSSAEINSSTSQGVAQGSDPDSHCLLANIQKGQRPAQLSADLLAGPVSYCFARLERREFSTETRMPEHGGLSAAQNTS